MASEQLSRCLSELTQLFESMQASNTALLEETASLKARLEAIEKEPVEVPVVLPGSSGEAPLPPGMPLPLLANGHHIQDEPPPPSRPSSKYGKRNQQLHTAGVINSGKVQKPKAKLDIDDAVTPIPRPSSEPPVFADAEAALGSATIEMTEDHPQTEVDIHTLASQRLRMLQGPPELETLDEVKGDTLKDVLREEMWNGVVDMRSTVVFDQEGTYVPLLTRFVEGTFFKGLCWIAIVLNTVYTGVRVDQNLRDNFSLLRGAQDESEALHLEVEITFACWFGLELLLRIAAHKWQFLFGPECLWNLFDGSLVVVALVEVVFPEFGSTLSFLRILRATRVTRVVRLVRAVDALKQLRTMLFAMLNSFTALMWAFLLILIIVYAFSIVFGTAVASFKLSDIPDTADVHYVKELEDSYGNLYQTMITLFVCITGGDDWMQHGSKLRFLHFGEMYFVVFVFYIGFCVIGLLNVVTGVFVDSAVCTRTEDEVVQSYRDDELRTSKEVRKIFSEADADGSGTMSMMELVKTFEKPWVKAYFSGLNIDPSEAEIIFSLMDMDGSGSISIDEFVRGVMMLKGSAKSIDVLSIMFDQARFTMKFHTLCSYIEDQLRMLRKAVAPGEDLGQRMFSSAEMTLASMKNATKNRNLEKAFTLRTVRSSPSDGDDDFDEN